MIAGYTRPVNPSTADDIHVVDLFAGCGGLTAGFTTYRPDGMTRSPFRSVAAVEHDPAAAATYAANHASDESDHVWAGGIEDWDVSALGKRVDVILGGPPCQGFSALNRKGVGAERNELWREYTRVVKALQPKAFVMENVARFLSAPEFLQLKAETEKGGLLENYRLAVRTLVAADYGVPQRRTRAIVIATHADLEPIEHPARSHGDPRKPMNLFEHEAEQESLKEWKTVEEIFLSTAGKPLAPDLPQDQWWSPPGTAESFPGKFRTTQLHIGRNPEPISLARYAAIPPGGNRYDLTGKWASIAGESVYLSTPSWDAHRAGSGDVMGRMHMDRPSVTIRTEFYKPEKGRYLHPHAMRPITHLEAARIQGFPLDYLWCGSKVQIARQIGNAVPLGLGEALARVVHQGLTRSSSEPAA